MVPRVLGRKAVRRILFDHPALAAQSSVVPPRLTPLPLPVARAVPRDRAGNGPLAALGTLLAHLILHHGHRRVLAFGPVPLSGVLAAALEAEGGGRLTSVEADRSARLDWQDVENQPHVDAELVAAPSAFTIGWWGVGEAQPAALSPVRARGPHDLLVVHQSGGLGALPLASAALESGATIVVDAAARDDAQWQVGSWLRMYSGLRLWAYDPTFAGSGVVLLRGRGGRGHVSARAWLGSILHVLSGPRSQQ